MFALVVLMAVSQPPVVDAAAPPVADQNGAQGTSRPTDKSAPWSAWLGCWELLDERGGLPASASESPNGTRQRPRICVVPAEPDGISFDTYVGSERVLAQRVIGDGQPYPVADRECRGEQRTTWSSDQARMITTADVRCGAGGPRRITGLTMMAEGPTWVDIQHIEAESRRHVRVRRYARARDQQIPGESLLAPAQGPRPLDSGRPLTPSGARLTVPALAEMAAKLPPEVVEAAVVEMGAGFPVNKRSLIALDEADVPERIIDLLVALSYPSKFVVDRPTPFSGFGSAGGFGPGGGFGTPWGGGLGLLGGAAWAGYDDPYFWPYYASPIGFGYWGGLNSMYLPAAGYVLLGDDAAAAAAAGPVRSGTGRVVNGAGYTQVRPRVAVEATDAAAPAAGSDGGRGSGGRVSVQGYSGDGGGASSGGNSAGSSGASGGSGGDGGRTAQPR